jgi:hypothetical protein
MFDNDGYDVVRDVLIDSGLKGVPDHRLVVWDTHKVQRPYGHTTLGYAFYPAGSDEPLFSAEDYGCPAGRAIDSDATLADLLGFLTLKPGDTDSEYFVAYTQSQLEWATSCACETLALIPYDAESFGSGECEITYNEDDRFVWRELRKPVFKDQL